LQLLRNLPDRLLRDADVVGKTMSKIVMEKVVLSPIHTKYQVVKDFASTIPLKMKYKESNLKTMKELLWDFLTESVSQFFA
jgi:hypothetical protein